MPRTPPLKIPVTTDLVPLKTGLKRGQSQIKSFSASVRSMGATMGLAFGGAALISGIGSAIGKIGDFEEQMDTVRAVSRATGAEVEKLKNNALSLGASTKFTAIEIGAMQEVMARLGKTTTDIIGTTDSVSKLAIATGAELAPAAELMTKTMNAFNLETSEASRVANIMAEATANSALNMEDLGVGLSYAGSSGRAFGWEVEKVTAALGILQDNGIDASKAGTGLRKIFIQLAESGMSYDEAMKAINLSTNKLKTASELFGKTAANQAVILSQNQESLEGFTKSLSDSNLEMDEMVRIMEDNLNTDLKKLGSAFDGLIQKGGALTPILRGVTQEATDFFNILNSQDLNVFEKILGSSAIGVFFKDYFVEVDKAGKKIRELEGKISAKQQDNALKSTVNAAFNSGNIDAYIKALSNTQNKEAIIEAIRKRQAQEEAARQAKALQDQQRITAAKTEFLRVHKYDGAKELQTKGLSTDGSDSLATDEQSIAFQKMAASVKMVSAEMQGLNMATNGFMMTFEGLDEIFVNTNALMEDFSETMAMSLGNAFGDALSGVSNFGDSILGAVGAFMSQLGQMMITTAITVQKFKAVVLKFPAAAVAAGIALVAVGRAFSNKASAAVGNLGGGGSSSSGASVPSGRTVGLSNQQANQEVKVGGEFRLEGNTLIALIQNQNQTNGRIGGQTIGG